MMRPDRRSLLLGCLASLLARAAAGAEAAASLAQVSAPVAALDAGLLAVMKAGKKTPFPERYAMLEPILAQSFDLPRILEMSVGFGWPDLTESERQQLLAVFRQYTVASYVANFKSYDGEQFRILPDLRTVGQQQVVATEIVPREGKPNRIDFVLRQNGANWQVVDVLLDGTISQVAVQRSDFHSLLASGGATALINALKKKVASLSDNTLT
jgi:phospholipid transport system substrate-binding protein